MISFDIFDTLITRKTATPQGIFAIMQTHIRSVAEYEQLNKKILDDFYYDRIEAEKKARNRENNGEATLDEIYACLSGMYHLNGEENEQLKQLELDTESKNIVPITRNVERLKEYVRNGEKVVLISDMYLPQGVLRSLLVAIDDIFLNLPIYVSCEWRVGKSSGELFEIVKRQEKVSDWLHIGDNEMSDVKGAQIADVRTEKYEYPALLPNELYLLDAQYQDARKQVMVGISRNCRLDKNDDIAYVTGATLGAELLLPYAEWILRICAVQDISNLYFIARDGYILKRIIDKIIKREKLEIRTKYLYGSRKVWEHIAEVNSEDETANRARSYVKQEIDLTDKKIAFVEVNGTGRTQERLCNYMATFSDICEFINFHYTMERNIEIINHLYYTFIQDKLPIPYSIEMFTRAMHGMTVDYMWDGEKYQPVFEEKEQHCLEPYHYDHYIQGTEDASVAMDEAYRANNIGLDLQYISKEAFRYFLSEEKDIMYEYICDLPFSDKADFMKFAEKLSSGQIKDIFLWKKFHKWVKKFDLERISLSLRRCSDREKRRIERYKWISKKFLHEGNADRIINDDSDIKERVIVYCAGQFGQSLVARIDKMEHKHVVLWVDSNAEKDNRMSRIRPASEISNVKYDQIIIAVKSYDTMNEIKNSLILKGIEASRIYWQSGK